MSEGLMERRGIREEFFRDMERELHDLCQPVTAMQCRLELGKMGGTAEELLEASNGALMDTDRVFAAVARMRERLLTEDAAEQKRELERDGRE